MTDASPNGRRRLGRGMPLLDIKDISQWLNMKPTTLYSWVAHGKIPCVHLNGVIGFVPEGRCCIIVVNSLNLLHFPIFAEIRKLLISCVFLGIMQQCLCNLY